MMMRGREEERERSLRLPFLLRKERNEGHLSFTQFHSENFFLLYNSFIVQLLILQTAHLKTIWCLKCSKKRKYDILIQKKQLNKYIFLFPLSDLFTLYKDSGIILFFQYLAIRHFLVNVACIESNRTNCLKN